MKKYSCGDIVEAVSKLFEPFAVKGVDPDQNRWGIVVQYNKVDLGVIAFIFVTEYDERVQFTIDVAKQDRRSIQKMVDDFVEMLDEYRTERAKSRAPSIITSVRDIPEFKQSPLSAAVSKAIH
jgi:hypothetical protein